MDAGVLTETLNRMIGVFRGGYERLEPTIDSLLGLLAAMDLVVLGMLIALQLESLRKVFRSLFMITMWAMVIGNFGRWSEMIVTGMIRAGGIASGNAVTRATMSPSGILASAIGSTQVVFENMSVLQIGMAFSYSTIMTIAILLAHIGLALAVFIAFIEYYAGLAMVGIALPFAAFGPTRDLAWKPFGFLIATAFRLMVLAMLVGTTRPLLATLRPQPGFDFQELLVCTTGCIVLAVLCWVMPSRLGQAMLGGTTAMGGAGDVVAPVVAAVTMGRYAVNAAVKGMQGTAGAAGATGAAGASGATGSAGAPGGSGSGMGPSRPAGNTPSVQNVATGASPDLTGAIPTPPKQNDKPKS